MEIEIVKKVKSSKFETLNPDELWKPLDEQTCLKQQNESSQTQKSSEMVDKTSTEDDLSSFMSNNMLSNVLHNVLGDVLYHTLSITFNVMCWILN